MWLMFLVDQRLSGWFLQRRSMCCPCGADSVITFIVVVLCWDDLENYVSRSSIHVSIDRRTMRCQVLRLCACPKPILWCHLWVIRLLRLSRTRHEYQWCIFHDDLLSELMLQLHYTAKLQHRVWRSVTFEMRWLEDLARIEDYSGTVELRS